MNPILHHKPADDDKPKAKSQAPASKSEAPGNKVEDFPLYGDVTVPHQAPALAEDDNLLVAIPPVSPGRPPTEIAAVAVDAYQQKIAALKKAHVAEAQAALDLAKKWEPAGVVLP